MSFFVSDILGMKGIISLIGFVVFLLSFKYSQNLFNAIEKYTAGNREYILEKLDLLFIEIDEKKITYLLLFLSIGLSFITIMLFAILGWWTLGVFLGAIVAFIGFKIPRPFINFLVDRRIKKYSGQMVDALTLLANGLRAGLSVPQSLGIVVDELPDPVSQEFNMILQQNRIGVTLEECFENLVKRVPTEDNDMFVASVNILRETGGNLSETFDTIVHIIRERIRLQQKIDSFTAQGKFQGYLMALMPLLIGSIFASSNPDSMMLLFTTLPGNLALFGIVALDLFGLWVILKIVDIKV